MMEELKKYSDDQGIAFYLKYEQQSSAINSLLFLRSLKDKDLNQIKTKLDKVKKKINENTFQLSLINQSHKSEAQVLDLLSKCRLLVQKEAESRQKNEGNFNQNQNAKKTRSKGQIVFSVIKIVIIGLLSVLFVISLFSSGDDWGDEDGVDYDRESSAKIEQKINPQPLRHQTSEGEQEVSTLKQRKFQKNKEKKQVPSTKLSQSVPTQSVNVQSNSPINQQIQTKNKIEFSSVQYIQQPLEYIYEILQQFLPEDVAYFLCAYVLWAAAWILAIALGLG